jgi:hypothetical protein
MKTHGSRSLSIAIAALALLSGILSSPGYALTFYFSFEVSGGTITGEIDGLTAGGTNEDATNVFLNNTAGYSSLFPLPYDMVAKGTVTLNSFDVSAAGDITAANFFSNVPSVAQLCISTGSSCQIVSSFPPAYIGGNELTNGSNFGPGFNLTLTSATPLPSRSCRGCL